MSDEDPRAELVKLMDAGRAPSAYLSGRELELANQNRIRRGDEVPDTFSRELGLGQRYPRTISLEELRRGMRLRYRRTRPTRMDGGDCVRRREVFAWIYLGPERVGGLEFVEFDPDPLSGNESFFDDMDSYCAADAAVGEVLCDQWSDVTDIPGGFGPIVEFRAAWMKPLYARDGLWVRAAEALIGQEFKDYSILIMKALPLEYEGRAPKGMPSHQGLEQRQSAMIRYYKRLFGVEACPGESGGEGWLWRPNPTVETQIREEV